MLRVTYTGHATLLIEVEVKRFLTDPNFDTTLCGVLPRVSLAGIALYALPKLYAILFTYAHADHMSFDSLDALPRDIPLYAPPAVARWLVKQDYKHALPLAPGECTNVDNVRIRAASATHKGHRYSVDRWRSAANMYLFETTTVSAFFAGDTALVADTTQLVESHLTAEGRVLDIALLPIGHAPWWKPGFRKGHLTSADALTLFERLKAKYLIPYHWGTFNHVTSTAFDAIDRLRTALQTHPLRSSVKILEPGTTFILPTPES